jgi:hypothetical protein
VSLSYTAFTRREVTHVQDEKSGSTPDHLIEEIAKSKTTISTSWLKPVHRTCVQNSLDNSEKPQPFQTGTNFPKYSGTINGGFKVH